MSWAIGSHDSDRRRAKVDRLQACRVRRSGQQEEPRSGGGLNGDVGQGPFGSGGGNEAAGVGPRVDAPLAAGVDNAEAGGVEPAAFIGSGPEADAPGDHGVAQRALGLVVGRRQTRVRDEGDDRVPVVEDFTGKVANLLLDVVAVALAVPLDAGHRALDGLRFRIAVVDPLDEPPQVTHEVTTEAGAVASASARPLRMRWARQRWRRA